MDFKFSFIWDTLPDVLAAIPITLFLTGFPVVLGAVIGFFLALIRIKKIPVIYQLTELYISFFRSVPLLILLFCSYYGIPKLLNFVMHGGNRVLGVTNVSALGVALSVLTLYSGAYITEIIRGALSSVDMKQMEAAHSIGMTKKSSYFRIILPQAVIVALPNYFNFVLSTLKNTSVVFAISVMDIMATAKLAAETGYRFIEAYVLVGALYVLIGFITEKIFRNIENNAKRHVGIEM
jgi:His/Glu/Gln/Arg/opine family amino acid ABC transporter permease subunit